MKIAILGAGFSGLATCWHLLQYKTTDYPIEIVVFDPKGIGGGTSGIAAGLLHPFAGAHAKYNLWGREGMQATQRLLDIASTALKQPVAQYTGMLRLATTKELHDDYLQCSLINPDVTWIASGKCPEYAPQAVPHDGILIKEGISVYSGLYLQGLWLACENKGAKLEKIACENLESLNDYDVIVVATGAGTMQFPELRHLPINTVKGQIIEYAWSSNVLPLSIPLNALGYVVMSPALTSCYAGSTYERDYQTEGPDLQAALNEIIPKVAPMLPSITTSKVLDCRAGMRATTRSRLPICKQVTTKCWVIAGMGSRGLLYHALMGETLARDIMNSKGLR